MWQTVSNVSILITCITFLLYIVGRVWKIFASKDMIFEKFEVIPYDGTSHLEDKDNVLIVDDIGVEFSISSCYGMRNVKVYKVCYQLNENGSTTLVSKVLKKTYGRVNINDSLFVRCDLGELRPITQIEIERMDYSIVTFDIIASGKTGNIYYSDDNYKFKLTLKSLLFYLCS